MNIYQTNSEFEFNKLTLAQPNGLQGGSYFTRLSIENNPIYIQAPQCQTKQGIVSSGKKTYCDLMFTGDNDEILEWFETLEKTIIDRIFEKRNLWFHNNLEKEDIENAFSSLIRIYKSGKFYLVRVNLANSKSQKQFTCYDDQENPVDPETIKNDNVKIIPLLEILGVKFSSKSFQIEICLRQTMVLNETEKFSTCLIKNNVDSDKNTNVTEDTITQTTLNTEETLEENISEPLENNDEVVNEKETMVTNSDNSNLDIISETPGNEESLSETPGNEESLSETPGNEESLSETSENDINSLDLNIENSLPEVKNDLEEVDFSLENIENNEQITLKKPNEVYFELWQEARQAAKKARKDAITAYLEAKKIKATYMLDELDDDSYDEFDNYLENLSEKEVNVSSGLG